MKNAIEEQEPTTHRFTRKEYYAMGDIGLFADKRVELIDGEIVDMSPQNSPHANRIAIITALLCKVCGDGFIVRVQLPMRIGNRSEPEPDLAVVKGGRNDFEREHPSTAELVIEIANARINYDRTKKGSLYARADIAEFWLIDLASHAIEVYREPVKERGHFFGFKYAKCQILHAGDIISPLFSPRVKFAVKDLLP